MAAGQMTHTTVLPRTKRGSRLLGGSRESQGGYVSYMYAASSRLAPTSFLALATPRRQKITFHKRRLHVTYIRLWGMTRIDGEVLCSSTLPTAEELVDGWIAHCSRLPGANQLQPENARPYRLVWLSWCRWLDERAPHPLSWAKATPADVTHFLQHSPVPKAQHVTGFASDITRRRYWRVLQRIYAFAVSQQQLAANPVRDDLPLKPPPERADSQVLPDPVWQALKELDWPVAHWTDLRDKALLGLFVELALTPQEVIGMRIPSEAHRAELGSLQSAVTGELVVVLDGPRAGQERELAVSTRLAGILRAWELQRRQLRPPAGAQDLLFVSMRLGPMTHRNLFHLCAGKLAAAYEATHMGGLPFHIGPLALRNTNLHRQLRAGVAPEEVARFAGLKNARSLLRLQGRGASDQAKRRRLPRPPPADQA